MTFTYTLEINAVSIVLIGSFNPAIFNPLWFKVHDLIKPDEADSAKLEITHPEVSSFSTDWLKLQVLHKRFAAATTDPSHFPSLKDLVRGTFSLLEHTPVSKMGLNRLMHFRMSSTKEWHEFGDLVAPKEHWKVIMNKPGLISLRMEDPRTEGHKGYVRVKIEPSARIQPGVFVEVNNHYESESENGLEVMMGVLESSWSNVLSSSEEIAKHLFMWNK